jgi:hypothetical protein
MRQLLARFFSKKILAMLQRCCTFAAQFSNPVEKFGCLQPLKKMLKLRIQFFLHVFTAHDFSVFPLLKLMEK